MPKLVKIFIKCS